MEIAKHNSFNYRKNWKQNGLFLLLGFLVILKYAINVHHIHLGFDVFDEGFLLLMLKYPDEYSQQIFLYHKIWNFFLPGYIEVLYLRYIKLAADLAVMTFFCISFYLCFKRVMPKFKLPPFVFLLIIGGLAIGINSIERVYSYSSMNYSLVAVAISFFLFLPGNTTFLRRYSLLLVVGVLLAIDFHIKLSSSVVVLLFMTGFLWLEKQYLESLFFGLFYLISIVLIGSFFYGNYNNWWNAFSMGLANSQLEGYGSSTFYAYYLLIPIYKYIKLFFLPILVFVAFYFAGKKLNNHRLCIASYMLSIIVAIAVMFVLPATYMVNEMQLYKPFVYQLATIPLYIFLLSFFFLKPFEKYQLNSKSLCIGLLLFITPFIIYFGSMGALEESLIFGWLPMILLGFIIVYNLENRLRNFALLFLVPILLVVTFYFNAYYPVRSLENYRSQTVEIQMEGEKLLVDAATAQFFIEVDAIINAYVANDDEYFLALNNLPGLVYYTGHKSPSVPLYLDFPIASEMNIYNLNHSLKFVNALDNRVDIKIILMNEDVHPALASAVQKALNLEIDYQKVDRLLNPYQGRLYYPQKDSIYSNVYIRK